MLDRIPDLANPFDHLCSDRALLSLDLLSLQVRPYEPIDFVLYNTSTEKLLRVFSDVGSVDVGSVDVGSVDVGSVDVASVDVGSVDVGSVDVGSVDDGSVDDKFFQAYIYTKFLKYTKKKQSDDVSNG
jgi:hypothetical protein